MSDEMKHVHDWIMSIDEHFDVNNCMDYGDLNLYTELNGNILL